MIARASLIGNVSNINFVIGFDIGDSETHATVCLDGEYLLLLKNVSN